MLANEKAEVPKEQVETPKTGKEKYTVTTNSKTGLTEEEEKKLKENLDNGFTQKMNQKIKIIQLKDETNSLLIKMLNPLKLYSLRPVKIVNLLLPQCLQKFALKNVRIVHLFLMEKLLPKFKNYGIILM